MPPQPIRIPPTIAILFLLLLGCLFGLIGGLAALHLTRVPTHELPQLILAQARREAAENNAQIDAQISKIITTIEELKTQSKPFTTPEEYKARLNHITHRLSIQEAALVKLIKELREKPPPAENKNPPTSEPPPPNSPFEIID